MIANIVALLALVLGAATVSNATYWPSGMPRTLSFQNGVTQDFTEQSVRPLVNSLTIKKGSAAAALALGYQYDTVANLTGVTDATNLGYARSVSYDLFDRLRTDNSEAITYTGMGDIATKTGTNGVASSYVLDANKRLQSTIEVRPKDADFLIASVTGSSACVFRAATVDRHRFSFIGDIGVALDCRCGLSPRSQSPPSSWLRKNRV